MTTVPSSPTSFGSLWIRPETLAGLTALIFLGLMGFQAWHNAGNLGQTSPTLNEDSQALIQQSIIVPTSITDTATSSATEIQPATPSAEIDVIPEEPTAATSSATTPDTATTTIATATSTLTPIPTSPTDQQTLVEPLPPSSTSQVVLAQVNDTFWDIARRTCGEGVQGYRIREENGYIQKHLHPGDEIVVTCN